MENKKQKLIDNYPDIQILFADGLNDAIAGFDEKSERVIYDVEEIIQCLIKDGMTYEEAEEYYGFNIECAYVGKKTPIYMKKINDMI